MGGILGKVLDAVHSSVQCWGAVGAQRGLEEHGRRAPGSLAKGSVHAGHRVGEGPVTSRRLGFLAQPWGPWPSLSRPYKQLPCVVLLIFSRPGQNGPSVWPEPETASREVAGRECSERAGATVPLNPIPI